MSINLSVPESSEHTELKPRITVVGVGGAGGNAVNNMIQRDLAGVDFVVANTDAQALMQSRADRRIQLGAMLTEGLGASHSLDGGFTFLASDALQFDVNVGVGLNETAEDWFIGGGFAFRLPHKDQSSSMDRVPRPRLGKITGR